MISYDRRAVELDFMVSARLNYLHVMFLLRLTLGLRISEPDAELLVVSAEMLSLVAQAVVLKHRLVNSGTSLIWKASLALNFYSRYLYKVGGLLWTGCSGSHFSCFAQGCFRKRRRGGFCLQSYP
ncbi:hypothetical protein BU16DRAFT_303618 [Lophium mytilinum]|uniref:Uncharacterized protein n=1 Tax=Lophium mytilinum TaxID=390894 RepID=A0A6A6R2N0_9PEZI|nr:hypothetical protein BU16DRAFT_303618 [Lophium mytilinum]